MSTLIQRFILVFLLVHLNSFSWGNQIAITNARIYTGTSQEWAEAVKIENGKFTYVGNAQDLKKHINSSTVLINMQGKVILPGLIDAHTHPGYVAGASEMIELPHTGTKEDVFAALIDHVNSTPGNDFIIGGYWKTSLFDERGPTKEELDEVVSDRPVLLIDWSGHSQWLNSKALEVMGINRDTPDPVPGLSFFYRDDDGNPTGWAKEFAVRQQLQALGLSGQFDANKLLGFLKYLRSVGVTTVYDAGNGGVGEEIYEILSALDKNGRLPVRYEGSYHVILPNQFNKAIETIKRWQKDYGGTRLNINTLKIHFDGMSEIGTSSVIDPFINNDNENRGGMIMTEKELHDHPFQFVNLKKKINFNIFKVNGLIWSDLERTQDWPKIYISSSALKITRTEYFLRYLSNKSPLFKKKVCDIKSTTFLKISKIESYDINNQFDLGVAKHLIKNENFYNK